MHTFFTQTRDTRILSWVELVIQFSRVYLQASLFFGSVIAGSRDDAPSSIGIQKHPLACRSCCSQGELKTKIILRRTKPQHCTGKWKHDFVVLTTSLSEHHQGMKHRMIIGTWESVGLLNTIGCLFNHRRAHGRWSIHRRTQWFTSIAHFNKFSSASG